MENNNALERCKQWVAGTSGLNPGASPKEVAEYIFPELRESEDEKIRKDIIAFLQSMNSHCNPTQDWDLRNRWLPYLERQKEQKPAEWRPIDDEYMSKLCEVIDEYEAERVWKESIKRWLKSLRPSWKPSEEQRHIEGQDTCYLNKQKLVNFIEDRIAENLENTTDANHDNHEGYHQACWDILYFIKQASK